MLAKSPQNAARCEQCALDIPFNFRRLFVFAQECFNNVNHTLKVMIYFFAHAHQFVQRKQERNIISCICTNQIGTPLTFVITAQHERITAQTIDQRRKRLVGNKCIPRTLHAV